jgi:hypothetical protein
VLSATAVCVVLCDVTECLSCPCVCQLPYLSAHHVISLLLLHSCSCTLTSPTLGTAASLLLPLPSSSSPTSFLPSSDLQFVEMETLFTETVSRLSNRVIELENSKKLSGPGPGPANRTEGAPHTHLVSATTTLRYAMLPCTALPDVMCCDRA